MNLADGVTLSAAAMAFDGVAGVYDEVFTNTAIGRAQRKQVWRTLLAAFPPESRILELNCGTGEDARFLTERGRYVTACDGSTGMIETAKKYRSSKGGTGQPEFVHLANEDLGQMRIEGAFDGVLSNFSGLNCVADLKGVASNLANLVKPGGRALLCLWSRVCAAEFLWYLGQGQATKAVRRWRGVAKASVGGKRITVLYPTVGEVRRAFSPWFELKTRRAVGLFVPPSYLEESIRKHNKLLARLEWLDSVCAEWPILRDAGDHVLLEFVRCKM